MTAAPGRSTFRDATGHRALALAAALAASAALGCSTPVGSSRADAESVQRELDETVLSTGELSAPSLQTFERLGIRLLVEEDTEQALQVMVRAFRTDPDPALLYALAELSYLQARRTEQRATYLAAAVYAYALLLPGEGVPSGLERWDPRMRTSFDLYNRALMEALDFGPGSELRPGGELQIGPGRLVIDWNPDDLVWNGFPLRDLIPASHLSVRGLRNRYRKSGIGAPFIAALDQERALTRFEESHVPPGLKVPITVFLRIEEPREAIARGEIRARLEVYSPEDVTRLRIDGRSVPLETDTTAALAHTLEGSRVWDTELAGLFRSELRLPGFSKAASGLLMTHPYQPGRIPLVLVHGTASSPARWAELLNEIENDPRLGSRYQVWLYLYNTGSPIAYSGAMLARSLREAVAELDPQGRDPALRDMVLLGHSQGGLLIKLTAVDSGDRFWERVSERPFAAVDLPPERRERLQAFFYFEPLPCVKRVIFVATPHRGSYLASFSFAHLVSDLITLPREVADAAVDLGTLGKDSLALRKMDRLPTSLDNMTPGNPFIQVLASLPVAPGIAAHSIIAVKRAGPPQGQSDGVVRYESAHLDGVESEKIVRSGHSAQGAPETINEVRRILREHLRGRDTGARSGG